MLATYSEPVPPYTASVRPNGLARYIRQSPADAFTLDRDHSEWLRDVPGTVVMIVSA